MSSKLITKKEMKRNSKAELLKIAKGAGLQVSKKMSKVMIVDLMFNNKPLRASMKVPNKKPPSAAQLKARNAFAERARKGKKSLNSQELESSSVRSPKEVASTSAVNTKSRVKIDPTASNQLAPPQANLKPQPITSIKVAKKIASTVPTMKVNTDKAPKEGKQIIGKVGIVENKTHKKSAGKLVATDFKFSSIIKGKANKNATLLKREFKTAPQVENKRRTHIQELRQRMKNNKQIIKKDAVVDFQANNKISDRIDRKILNGSSIKNNIFLKQSLDNTLRREDKTFGDLEDLVDEVAITDDNNPLKKVIDLLLLRQKVKKEFGNKPLSLEEERKQRKIGEPIIKEEEEEKQEEQEQRRIVSSGDSILDIDRAVRKKDLVRLLGERNIRMPVRPTKSQLVKIFVENTPTEQIELTILNKVSIKAKTDGRIIKEGQTTK